MLEDMVRVILCGGPKDGVEVILPEASRFVTVYFHGRDFDYEITDEADSEGRLIYQSMGWYH